MSNVDRGWRFYSMRNELRPREEFSFPKWYGMRIERLHAKALVAPKDAENGGNNNFNKKKEDLKFFNYGQEMVRLSSVLQLFTVSKI